MLTIVLVATSFSSLIVESGSRTTGGLPPLADVLNLASSPAGLAFAILFGYAPNLLLAAWTLWW